MRALIVAILLLLPVVAVAEPSSRDLGTVRPPRGGGIRLSIKSGEPFATLNGPALTCFDEHVIESVAFFGLRRADLEKLRALIDEALAATPK